MSTDENTDAAFTGESRANRKYASFAEKAHEDGFNNIARLFKAASDAEAIHARRLLRVLGRIGTTEENLQAAIEGETYEYTEMYPAFLKEAEDEKKGDAVTAFSYAMQVEEVHARVYREALNALKGGQDLSNRDIHLCPVCGYIWITPPPDKCPVCKVFKKVFRKITDFE